MPFERQVVEVEGEPTRICYKLKSLSAPIVDSSSVINFEDLLKSAQDDVASESHEADRNCENLLFRLKFRMTKSYGVAGELKYCHRRCIELLNSENLPADLKIETLQLLATIAPLDQAPVYLKEAVDIVLYMKNAYPEEPMWMGMLITTRDILMRIRKHQGAIKFHREVTFGDPYAAARDRDLKKGEPGKKVQFSEEAPDVRHFEVEQKMRPIPMKVTSIPKSLYRPQKVLEWDKAYTLRENLEPKYACSPFL